MAAAFDLDVRARRFGDDVNTDYIISSARKRVTIDETVLQQYLLEAVDPEFAASVRPGDAIVAGRNFGCGSAMEVAVTVMLAAGMRVVLARSFARSFFRNAINNGLWPVECDTSGIAEGDRLSIFVEEHGIRVADRSTGAAIVSPPLPSQVFDIVAAGGLVEYLRRHGRFPGSMAG